MILTLNVKKIKKNDYEYVVFKTLHKDVWYEVFFHSIQQPSLYHIENYFRAYIEINSTQQFDISTRKVGQREYPILNIFNYYELDEERLREVIYDEQSKIKALRDAREQRKRDFLEI